MLERLERQLTRLTTRAHFWLLSRLHPELTRLTTDKDREWAIWYAGAKTPSWQRYLFLGAALILGPLAVLGAVFFVAWRLKWMSPTTWPFMLLGGWILGFLTTGVLIEFARGRLIRSNCYPTLRIFGYDVCPKCGYDMSGHTDALTTARLCPECGAAVPALDRRQRAA